MESRLVLLISIIITISIIQQDASATCCPSNTHTAGHGPRCEDDSSLYCCGRGPCNVFCCNCVGGCRTEKDDVLGVFKNKNITHVED